MTQEITKEMVKAAQDQWRLDSSVLLTPEKCIERMLRAALNGESDPVLFNQSIPDVPTANNSLAEHITDICDRDRDPLR